MKHVVSNMTSKSAVNPRIYAVVFDVKSLLNVDCCYVAYASFQCTSLLGRICRSRAVYGWAKFGCMNL